MLSVGDFQFLSNETDVRAVGARLVRKFILRQACLLPCLAQLLAEHGGQASKITGSFPRTKV
jgi:hypothetical protein